MSRAARPSEPRSGASCSTPPTRSSARPPNSCLYFACRAQNVEQSILPALGHGEIVLSDRFTDSTLAYQGVGRGLGKEVVLALDAIACRGLVPDLTLLIDIDLETSLSRARSRNRELSGKTAIAETRMDDQAVEFHRRVHDAYAELVAGEPRRFAVIDGRRDVQTVFGDVWRGRRPRASGTCMFEDFHGNQRTTRALTRMLEQERIPQTLLLAGPQGVGKATLARRLARRPHRGPGQNRTGRFEPASQRLRNGRAREMALRALARKTPCCSPPNWTS